MRLPGFFVQCAIITIITDKGPTPQLLATTFENILQVSNTPRQLINIYIVWTAQQPANCKHCSKSYNGSYTLLQVIYINPNLSHTSH